MDDIDLLCPDRSGAHIHTHTHTHATYMYRNTYSHTLIYNFNVSQEHEFICFLMALSALSYSSNIFYWFSLIPSYRLILTFSVIILASALVSVLFWIRNLDFSVTPLFASQIILFYLFIRKDRRQSSDTSRVKTTGILSSYPYWRSWHK